MKNINFKTNTYIGSACVNKSGRRSRKVAVALFGLAGIVAPAAFIVSNLGSVHAETAETTFNVNVKESLAVSITTPAEHARGDAGEFLRNKVSLNVNTNSSSGFTASMYSQTNTDLTNELISTETIPTLASRSTKSSFPSNRWGYSLGSGNIDSSLNNNTYGETDAGNNNSYYHPLSSNSASPIAILTGTDSGAQDIYFGAKADLTTASGTYTNTVVISVVTGVIDPDTNPITPENPAKPSNTNNTPTYSGSPIGSTSSGSTTYTYRTSSGSGSTGTKTTTTQVSEGDNVSAYDGYTPPQGVFENTFSNIYNGTSPLASALAATSAAAAATGTFFFILAKRRDEDEEEESVQ